MKGEVIRRRQTITIRRYARRDVVNADGLKTGTTTDFEKFTDTAHEVDLEIDIAGLFKDVGEKAARSIGGRSIAVSGRIIARRRS